MRYKNISELLVETLVQAGVKSIYGVSGDSLTNSSSKSEIPPAWPG